MLLYGALPSTKLILCRAGELAQSVYGLNSKPGMRIILRRVNLAGKAMAIVLPLITILLLRVPAIQKVFVVFILIADLPCRFAPSVTPCSQLADLPSDD